MDPRFTLIGLIIGFLIGLTGMGGGSLMTPVMILIMGVKPLVAVGTDLAYGAVTRIVGGTTHWRMGTVHRRTALLLACGSVPSTLLGVGIVAHLKSSDPAFVSGFLIRSIAWALIFVSAALFCKPWLVKLADRRRNNDVDWRDALEERTRHDWWILPAIGAFVGLLVGLTSVGAGTVIIVALLFMYPRWQSKDLVGTDVFHAALLVSAASIAQMFAGNVNVPMMLSLLIGSVPGVLLGSRLAIGFPEQVLRISMAGVLLISGAKLL